MDQHTDEPGEAKALGLLSVVLLILIAAFGIMLFVGASHMS